MISATASPADSGLSAAMPATATATAPGPYGHLVYFSSVSENTHRFVTRLGVPAQRIPLRPKDPAITVTQPYVLVVPTYGGGIHGGAVPKQVIKFLNEPDHRSLIRGVIAAGNTNFGEAYCLAGPIVANKCKVPYLYGFELMGTAEDITDVRAGLEKFWLPPTQPSA